jgi:hypothetical protein
VLILLVAALVAVAVTSNSLPSNLPFASQSHVQTFVNAVHDNLNTNNNPSETLRSWQDTPQGSDSSRMQWTTYNSYNGTTTTFDFQVKEFKQTSDATNFVDSMSTGYGKATGSSILVTGDTSNSAYTKAMGHNPSKVDAYLKINSFFPASLGMIFQMDEFVWYGSATA